MLRNCVDEDLFEMPEESPEKAQVRLRRDASAAGTAELSA